MSKMKSAYVQSNEVVKATDINLGFDAQITNISKMIQGILEARQDFIIGGLVEGYSSSGLSGLNVKVNPIFGVCKNNETPFIETSDISPISIGEGWAVDRIDILEAWGELVTNSPEQRAFIDFDTKEKTLRTVDTQKELVVHIEVKHNPNDGTVYSTAPSKTTNRVKIAEIFVPANATDIDECEIYNVTSDIQGQDNEGWTTDKQVTYNIGYISSVNERFRVQHEADGTHKPGIIGKTELNLNGTDENQFKGSDLTSGQSISINGNTYGASTSITSLISTLAAKITDLFNSYLKYGAFNFNGEIAASSLVESNILSNAIKIGAAGDGTGYLKIGDRKIFDITTNGQIRMPSGYVANANTDLITKSVTDAISSALSLLTERVSWLEQNADPTAASNLILSKFNTYADIEVATTKEITLFGTQIIDGVECSAGMLVLVKDQTDKKENGIYEVSNNAAWLRSNSYSTTNSLIKKFFTITNGTTNKNKIFYSETETFVIGENDIIFLEAFFRRDAVANKPVIRDGNGVIRGGKANVVSLRSASDFTVIPNLGLLADLLYPVGFVYTQYPGCKNPVDLGLYGTWNELNFGGAFFRSGGGNAKQYTEPMKVTGSSTVYGIVTTDSPTVTAYGTLAVGDYVCAGDGSGQIKKVTAKSNNQFTIESAFSNNQTTVIILQASTNLSHNHSGNSGSKSLAHTHTQSGTFTTGANNRGHTHGKGTYRITEETSVQGHFYNRFGDLYGSGAIRREEWGYKDSPEWGQLSTTGGTGADKIIIDTNYDTNCWTGSSGGESQNHTHSVTISGNTGGMSANADHSHTISSDGGTESRPMNITVKLWKRTA